MELVKVNITTQALTARYGTLNPGDSVLTDAQYANHLVHDCGAGEYAKPPAAAVKEAEAAAAAKDAEAAAAAAKEVEAAAAAVKEAEAAAAAAKEAEAAAAEATNKTAKKNATPK